MRFSNFLARLSEKYRAFMYGRYGTDALSFALIIFGVVLSLGLSFIRTHHLWGVLLIRFIIYIPYLIALWRMLSKDISARQKENAKFLKFAEPWKRFFLQKYRQSQDITHKYYRCPKCHNNLRVPKGKGKIKINCPHCGKEFVKNTGKL